MFFVVFDAQTGCILRTGTVDDTDVPLQASNPGETVMEGQADDRTDYVNEGAITARPAFDLPDEVQLSVGGVPISYSVPPGTTATIDGVDHMVDDGDLELEAMMPATYTIELKGWPYLPKTVKVTAA